MEGRGYNLSDLTVLIYKMKGKLLKHSNKIIIFELYKYYQRFVERETKRQLFITNRKNRDTYIFIHIKKKKNHTDTINKFSKFFPPFSKNSIHNSCSAQQ